MALIRPNVPGEEWYQVVQQHYQTSHTDTGPERLLALQTLDALQKTETITVEQFAQKVQSISRAHSAHRYKLSTLIAGRFWDQQLQTVGIQGRGYVPPGPWQGSTTDVLKP